MIVLDKALIHLLETIDMLRQLSKIVKWFLIDKAKEYVILIVT